MSKKRGSAMLANQLRAKGVDLPPLDGSKLTFDPLINVEIPRNEYAMIWTQYDLQQYCARRKWKNLPGGMASWELNRMLYFRGAVMAFEYKGEGFILPFVGEGVSTRGLPIKGTPLSYTGNIVAEEKSRVYFPNAAQPRPIKLGWTGEESDANKRGYVLYSVVPFSQNASAPLSPFMSGRTIINEIADTLARGHINIVVSNKKILLVVKDPNQADIARAELRAAFGSDSPFGVITSSLDVQNVQTTSDFNADELFNTVKNWDAIRCFMRGIQSKNFGTEKKERLITGELAGNAEQVDLVNVITDEFAERWRDSVNKAFGWGVEYEDMHDSYNEMTGEVGNKDFTNSEDVV